MLTVTFEPSNPKQAELLGKFLPEYLRAGETTISLAPAEVRVPETPVAEEAAAEAPKAKRVRKSTSADTTADPAPTAPTAEEAPETAAPAPSESTSTGTTSETTSQAAPTPTETTAATEVSLEQVRGKLAELSQAGKASAVKGLIGSYGVAKLTEVPKDKYAELLARAEELA